jgi:hypothetical protein
VCAVKSDHFFVGNKKARKTRRGRRKEKKKECSPINDVKQYET